MMLQKVLAGLLTKKKIPFSETLKVFTEVFQGALSDEECRSFLILLAERGETASEVTACVRALQQLEKPIAMPYRSLLDTCGTGGDGKQSINVSTLAAFVLAGAGVKVAKHGNRAITSRAGSSDLMEALGVKIDAPLPAMKKALRQAGIAYFHAPVYHPVFARLQPLRKKIGMRTIFNLLGPLVNPCRVAFQLTGVSRKEHVELYSEVFRTRSGLQAAMVCHSEDGMDEISLSSNTHYAWIAGGKIRSGMINPRKLGFKAVSSMRFKGGSASDNARFARQFLSGKVHDARRDLILINAAAGLWLTGFAKDLADGLHLAALSVDSGRAHGSLERLVLITNKG